MPGNCRAIATFGWDTGDVVTYSRAIATYGWGIDNAPAPSPAGRMAGKKMIQPGEQNLMDVRRAFLEINNVFKARYSVTTGIVASSTQTQGDAEIWYGISVVETVISTDDSVTMPDANSGNGYCKIANEGASTLQVFPATDEAIDDNAVNISISIAAGKVAVLEAVSDTQWYMLQG